MDDLRLALLVAGIAIVVGIVLYTLLVRRRRSARNDGLRVIDRDPDFDAGEPLEIRASPIAETESSDESVEDLGGVFAARRETASAELSVDVSVLAGLRATYESTVGGDSLAAEDEDSSPAHDPCAPAPAQETPARARAAPPAASDAGNAGPITIDMTRPMVYLMLVARAQSLSGRLILESLDGGGFRPGALQLYYWQSDSDPAVVFGVANLVEPGVLEPETLQRSETPGLVTFMSIPQEMALAMKTFNAMVEVSRRLARRIDAKVCDETQSTLTAQAENHLREKVADIQRRNRI